MPNFESYLRDWREAGIVDEAIERRVREFEDARRARPTERPTVLEALIYLGLAIIAVGVVVLVGSNWQHLQPWARIAVAAVPGGLGVLAGIALRSSALPAMRRGADVTWLTATALLTVAFAVIGSEADWTPEHTVLACGVAATALALSLWVSSPSHPQIVGVGVAVLLFSIGLSVNASEHEMMIASITIAAFGVTGILLAETGLLQPQTSARLLSALAFATGAYGSGPEDIDPAWAEVLVFVAAAALIALSIQRGVFVYMVAGVVALFVGLITVILRHVDDPTMASLALVIIGAVVIAVVMLLVQLRPWSRPVIAP
jgi:AcrR family transcriptional regulator